MTQNMLPSGFRFDHVNVQASATSPLRRLFCDVMGLHAGDRPPFRFPGTWLYGGAERALLHVVPAAATQGEAIALGHIAFRSDEAAERVLARLHAAGLSYEINVVPGDGDVQIFVPLPGGLVIELDLPGDGRTTLPVAGAVPS